MTQMQIVHIIKAAGSGYSDLTIYPLGGCFRRFNADTIIAVTRDYRAEGLLSSAQGYTHEGTLEDGTRVAVQARETELV